MAGSNGDQITDKETQRVLAAVGIQQVNVIVGWDAGEFNSRVWVGHSR